MLANSDITNALGGRKVLKKSVESSLEVSDMIAAGLPSESAFFLQNLLNLGDLEYSSMLGVSTKTLSRHRQVPVSHLAVEISDRLFRIARIFTLAEDVLENKKAAVSWFLRPQIGLNQRIPFELIKTEVGAREIEELLYRIEYGMYS